MCDRSVAYPPLPAWRPERWACDPAVLVEDLHGLGRDPNVDLAAAQRVGDAVERVLDLDVVVDVDPRLAPLGVLVALGRKRLERRPVQILEPAAAAAHRSSLNGRSFSAASSGPMASRSSPSEKNVWLRSGAMT